MRNLKRTILIILTVFLALSCQNRTAVPDYSAIYSSGVKFTDWGTLFDAFWHKMSTNYVFWGLDDESGTRWDEIHDEYLPKFKALGAIYDADGKLKTYGKNEAQRFFFDITKDLHDSHYTLQIAMDVTSEGRITLNPRGYRYIKSLYDEEGKTLNPNDDQIYAVTVGEDTESKLYQAMKKRETEHVFNIAFYSLTDGANQKNDAGEDLFKADTSAAAIAVASDGQTKYSFNFESSEDVPFQTVTDGGKEMNFFNFVSKNASGEAISAFYGALGYPDDGILYFSFKGFAFSEADAGHMAVIAKFRELAVADGTKAVIIDLRGNGGGEVSNLSLLWSVFMNDEPLTVGATRRKAGTNRTDYGPWSDFSIPLNAEVSEKYDDFLKEKPIAVLTNQATLSCSEVSTLFFAALRDARGFNVKIIGENGAGGFGMLNQYFSEIYYGTGVVNYLGQISMIYTPFLMLRYRDGVCYEGEGYPVDGEPILFRYSEFVNGKDAKLDAAKEWLKGEMK